MKQCVGCGETIWFISYLAKGTDEVISPFHRRCLTSVNTAIGIVREQMK